MCGGTLEINNSETVATCEYCGTQQTLPKLDDDKRANMYDRANHFRRNNEFDKAMSIYEQILNEDNTDAEAYWSLILCRYGIEYVEDPSSHKRLPTVNRAQFTSIFDDDNYKSALRYSDGYQRSIYEKEAKAINEIQKGILAISEKEEPFDIFICYKETDNNGRRTPDSVLATELYHQLINEGFKVFFARITLEDKLGSAYEPYIFAALNSAKVMVVLGTKPEYFNAVWVKNEWSRYLSLIKSGAKKILIPAYRDMDPYDLPEQFSHLQAQDMSKLGFMQDLIRGIKKITQTDEPKQTVIKETVVQSGSSTTAPLLKRAFMFLEDGEWANADEYCEKVLDLDPECAEAYLGKLMAELKIKKQDSLKDCAEPFDDKAYFQKVVRFGNDKIKNELNGYIEYIKTRNENSRLEGLYVRACKILNSAITSNDFRNAAMCFEDISVYKDSALKAKECLEKAKEVDYTSACKLMNNAKTSSDYVKATYVFNTILDYKDSDIQKAICLKKSEEAAENERKEAIYKTALNGFNKFLPSVDSLEDVINKFQSIIDYKDSAEKIELCKKKIQKIKENEILIKSEELKRAKRNKRIGIISAFIFCIIIAFIIVLNNVIIPNGKYNDAIVLMNSGNIVEAYEALIALDGYKDSADKASSIYDKYKVEKLRIAKVGDYVFFGAYEQDNNASNGDEDIEWLVLEVRDGKALVISKYALDCKPYNTNYTAVTWETCTLRGWLNNDFINSAFSTDEKAIIPTVTVSADKNPEYSTNSGNATQDQVFLLSIMEANKYFGSDSARQSKPTNFAVANGAYVNNYNGNCWWWLRSPGYSMNIAAYFRDSGEIREYGNCVNFDDIAVRPALWIDLNA